MTKSQIDINCDLGEINHARFPHHIEILDYISSCNIATGFHAGDPYTILKTIQEARHRSVAIGVHPSYPDKAGFGRISMEMSDDELYASLIYQTSALYGICKMAGARLHHIKLHGALYHDAHFKEEVANVVIRFLLNWMHPLMLYGQEGSLLERLALKNGIKWVSEGFIDRRYGADGILLSRNLKGALIEEPETSIIQALNLIRYHKVQTIDGREVNMNVRTLCIHGDQSGAISLARQLQNILRDQEITIMSPNV